jgi:hypothetical protein
MPQIGHDSEPLRAALNDKDDTVDSIMGRWNRPYADRSDLNRVTGVEMADIAHASKPVLRKGDIEGIAGYIKRKAVFTLKCTGMADMIGMIMGDDDSIHVPDIPAAGSEPSLCIDAAQARVKE